MTNEKLHRDLPSFSAELRELVREDGSVPPVETWNPARTGEIDIKIDQHGVWFHDGEEMTRMAVVRLLSTILRKEGEEYFLVTPAEKMKIQVDDVPFVVPMIDVEGSGEEQKIHLTTQVGDCFTLTDEHPLEFKVNEVGDAVPYVTVRSNLEAKLNRSVYYEMAELVEPDDADDSLYGVWSAGGFFRFG